MNLRSWTASVAIACAAALGGDDLTDDARALAITAPDPVVLGDVIRVRATFANDGTSTWDPRYGCLATWECQDPLAPLCAERSHSRVEPLGRSVIPGEWLDLHMELPTIAAGPHVIVLQLHRPDGTVFGDVAGPVVVEVTTDPPLSPGEGAASRPPPPAAPPPP